MRVFPTVLHATAHAKQVNEFFCKVVTSVTGYIVLGLVYWKQSVVLNDNQSVYAVNIINDTHGRKMAGCYIGFGLHCLRLSLFNTALAKICNLYTTLDDNKSVYMLNDFNGTRG